MFEKRKQRLMDRMEMLVAAAQFVTCTVLGEASGAYDATSDVEKNKLVAIAAAKANYLFARDPSEKHLTEFNMQSLCKEADAWLSSNPKMQELVVQSLRVQNIVRYGRSGTAGDPIGGALLEKYGNLFPAGPNLDSFPSLINESLNELSEEVKQDLIDAFARRGMRI